MIITRPKITVRRDPARGGLRGYGWPGWQWHCPCCDKGGRHSYRPRNGNPRCAGRTFQDPPFQRVHAAVEQHLWKDHRADHVAYLYEKRRGVHTSTETVAQQGKEAASA